MGAELRNENESSPWLLSAFGGVQESARPKPAEVDEASGRQQGAEAARQQLPHGAALLAGLWEPALGPVLIVNRPP